MHSEAHDASPDIRRRGEGRSGEPLGAGQGSSSLLSFDWLQTSEGVSHSNEGMNASCSRFTSFPSPFLSLSLSLSLFLYLAFSLSLTYSLSKGKVSHMTSPLLSLSTPFSSRPIVGCAIAYVSSSPTSQCGCLSQHLRRFWR